MAALHLVLSKFWYGMMKQQLLVGPENLETAAAFESSKEGNQSVLECLGLKNAATRPCRKSYLQALSYKLKQILCRQGSNQFQFSSIHSN